MSIGTARKFLKEATEEFEKGKKEQDEVRIRDSAEKAWNAVVQATNYLFEKLDYPVPKVHHERRKALTELGKRRPEFRKGGFRDRYMARAGRLHEDCFYDGIFSIEDLEEDMKKVKEYIDDVENLNSGPTSCGGEL